MSKSKSVNEAILKYLKKQNRPYSAMDVFNNLQNEHGKTAVIESLESLVEKNELKEKIYGKEKIYYINQNKMECLDGNQIKKMDEDIDQMASMLKKLQCDVKNKDNLLTSLKNSLTDEEIRNKTEQMQKENEEMKIKLEDLKSKAKDVPPEAKTKITKDCSYMRNKWKERKRLACNMLDAILEEYPKRKKAHLEETGVETDKNDKISFPESKS